MEAKLGLSYSDRHGKGYYTSQLKPEDVERVKENESHGNLLDGLNAWLERMPYFDDEASWECTEELRENHPFWKQYKNAYAESLIEIESGNLDLFDEVLFGKSSEGKRRLSPRAARAALFILLYRGYPILHLPYQLLISLLTTDELMATWRGRHMNMVFRMIGTRVGTGNSSGKGYLKAAMDKHYIFKELAELNGLLIDRRSLPELPKTLEMKLGFARQ